jgi:hypothetical protein
LSELSGSAGTLPPSQIVSEFPKLNEGIVLGVTVKVYVVDAAHCPASGVNVYVPETWLSTIAGLHVPVIPFDDVNGNAGTLDPAHIEALVPKEKPGVTIGFTVTVKLAVVAHTPATGVKV